MSSIPAFAVLWVKRNLFFLPTTHYSCKISYASVLLVLFAPTYWKRGLLQNVPPLRPGSTAMQGGLWIFCVLRASFQSGTAVHAYSFATSTKQIRKSKKTKCSTS